MAMHRSDLDEERFGVRTVRATAVTPDSLPALEDFCAQERAQFVIARVSAKDLDAVQQMEANDFRLMDTLVYYSFKFSKQAIPVDSSGHQWRPAVPADTDGVIALATASFQGYYGHYHADPRLPDADCDAVYIDWAANSMQSGMADDVLVVEDDSGLTGFATLRMNDDEEGEGVLFGVAPHAQGQGIYRTMMIHGMHWCEQRRANRMVVSTQITNVAVQKVWTRLGFEFNRAYYTLHRWIDT